MHNILPVMLRRELCCAAGDGPGMPLFPLARAAHKEDGAAALESLQECHQRGERAAPLRPVVQTGDVDAR